MSKNTEKSKAVASKILEYLERKRLDGSLAHYYVEQPTATALKLDNPYCLPEKEFARKVHAILIVGGDGAFLDAEMRFPGIPKLEINTGNVGFLAQIDEKFEHALDRFFEGKYRIEKRSKLQCRVGARKIEALNDVHVYAKKPSRPFNVRVFSQTFDEIFYANGIIFSTATGSTAHSFSVGGPVISPQVDAILMTPVAALNPLLHPVVFSSKEKLTLEVIERQALFSADGFFEDPVESMEVSLSPQKANLILLGKDEFWKKLRRKLFY